MPVQNPMPALYKRLRQAGIKTAFVKNTILPEWWEDDIAENPAEYASALSMISQASGISLEVLYDNTAEILKLGNKDDVKFKKSKNTPNTDILWTAEFGRFIARVIFRALPQTTAQEQIRLCTQSTNDIRRHIMRFRRTVDLDALLEYCFSCDIPVLHIPETKGAAKPHGMATRIDGRAAIVLFGKHKHPSRLAFNVAHELGHIMLGHLDQTQTVVDESIEGTSNNDPHEKQANDFANALLMGTFDGITEQYRLSGEDLARRARHFGNEYRIEPGTVALNYAHHKKAMPVAMKALNILEPNTDAPRTINETLLKNLAFDELSYETQDRLLRALGFTEYPAFLTTADVPE